MRLVRTSVTTPELREMGFTDREIERGVTFTGKENAEVLAWITGKKPWPFDGRRRERTDP